jgi:hypothetical protein
MENCLFFGRRREPPTALRRGLLFRVHHYELDAVNRMDGIVGVARDLRGEHLAKQCAKCARIRARDAAQVLRAADFAESLHDGGLDVGGQLVGHALLAAGTGS